MGDSSKMSGLIYLVVFILVAVLVFPLINSQIDDATNSSHDDYVGADSADLVEMIPLFYWLAVLLVAIGFALVAIRKTS